MKPLVIHPYLQFSLLCAWTLFAFLSVVAFRNPIRFPIGFRLIFYGCLASATVSILFGWFYIAHTGSGNLKFAWLQLLPTVLKVSAQTLLIAILLYALYALSRHIGEKALPHVLGIGYKHSWWPNPQVVLPSVILVGYWVALVISIWAGFLAFMAYGKVSFMGISALSGLILVVGSWTSYRWLVCKLEAEMVQRKEGTLPKNQYRRLMEYQLGTREWNALVFHRMAEEPFGLTYRFPGFLIGVEQANRYLIDVPKGDNVIASDGDTNGIAALLNDRRRTFVSHIYEFADKDPGTRDTLAAPKSEMVETKEIYNIYATDNDSNAFSRGFEALDGLKAKLETAINDANKSNRGYTHILVFCMGWNTDQQESIRNYNSLMGFLAEAAEKKAPGKFRPLVIGLSWPSEWNFLKPLSYLAKAGDADETGLVWGSYLLKQVLKPLKLKHELPLVVVGHSFGVRVLTRAVASNPNWVQRVKEGKDERPKYQDQSEDTNEIDLFFGLQGAVSANRFVHTGALTSGWAEGSPYKDLPKMKTRFILTWAEKDNANPLAAYVTGAHHVGGKLGHDFCLQHMDTFWPVIYEGKDEKTKAEAWPYIIPDRRYDPEIGWMVSEDSLENKIISMDVSSIVKEQPYGKGGGAHSDIYTPEVGRLLWNSIVAFASPRKGSTTGP